MHLGLEAEVQGANLLETLADVLPVHEFPEGLRERARVLGDVDPVVAGSIDGERRRRAYRLRTSGRARAASGRGRRGLRSPRAACSSARETRVRAPCLRRLAR